METLSFYRRKPSFGKGVFRHVGFDESGRFLFQDLMQEYKPWKVNKEDVKDGYDELTDFNAGIYTKDRVTCGRRHDGFSRGAGNQNMDYWEPDTNVCSYCGSISPKLFVEIIDKVNSGIPGYTVEMAVGKKYKYYVTTPDIPYAKFYVHHINIIKDQLELETLSSELYKAINR